MNLAVLELLTALPDGVVSSAEVNEEVPGPVSHLQEIPHALQVGGQEAGPAPDGGHSPGGDSDIVVLPGELEYLPMQVIGTLFPGDKGRKGTVNSPKTSAHIDIPATLLWLLCLITLAAIHGSLWCLSASMFKYSIHMNFFIGY